MNTNNDDVTEILNKVKMQGIREFAERLKKMMFITDYDIDELVKEMESEVNKK